jgi:hypothetical protein
MRRRKTGERPATWLPKLLARKQMYIMQERVRVESVFRAVHDCWGEKQTAPFVFLLHYSWAQGPEQEFPFRNEQKCRRKKKARKVKRARAQQENEGDIWTD